MNMNIKNYTISCPHCGEKMYLSEKDIFVSIGYNDSIICNNCNKNIIQQ